MKFDNNLAAIHAYLCADGYVIRNPPTQKHKYYYIGLRNTNIVLLKDFQKRFSRRFGLKPILCEDRCKIQSKGIYNELTKEWSFYSREWSLPKLSRRNIRLWLRAFFDCEGWVENQPHKSRTIRAESINETGLKAVMTALRRLGIDSKMYKRSDRTIWRLSICGKNDLIKFQKVIGFLHPNKKQRLKDALNSYSEIRR